MKYLALLFAAVLVSEEHFLGSIFFFVTFSVTLKITSQLHSFMNKGHSETKVYVSIKGKKDETFVKQQRTDSFWSTIPFCRAIKRKSYFIIFW